MSQIVQDWEPMVIRKDTKSSVGSIRPPGAKQFDNLNSDDPDPPKKPEHDFRVSIAQARQALKLTQKDLAAKINEQVSVIQKLENGTSMPTAAVLSKIKRVLKMK